MKIHALITSKLEARIRKGALDLGHPRIEIRAWKQAEDLHIEVHTKANRWRVFIESEQLTFCPLNAR